jgi:hypothetical protein
MSIIIMYQGLEGLVLILNILCSFVNTIKYPSTKLVLLDLFTQFSNHMDAGNINSLLLNEIFLMVTPHDRNSVTKDRSSCNIFIK